MTANEGRGQFTFYRSYYEAICHLPKRERLAVYEAVCAYALDGTEPVLTGVAASIFTLIQPVLETSRKKAMGVINNRVGHKEGE